MSARPALTICKRERMGERGAGGVGGDPAFKFVLAALYSIADCN